MIDRDVEWSGFVRVDPAAMLAVGDMRVSGAELERWVRTARMAEIAEPVMDARTARWWDVAICAVVLGALVCVVWLTRDG